MTPTLMMSGSGLASRPVEDAEIRARRANIQDLPALQALWQRAELPWDQLEKYFTEFIVIPGEEGFLRAAIGLQIDGQEALVHSEAILPNEEADLLRARLWERLQIVARNQGAVRLWTLEDAAYWRAVFRRAEPAVVSQLKSSFADPTAEWWTFQLIDPAKAQQLLDERLAIWEATRQSSSNDFSESIERFRKVAFLIAGTVIAVMLVMVLYVFMKRPDALQRLIQSFGGR